MKEYKGKILSDRIKEKYLEMVYIVFNNLCKKDNKLEDTYTSFIKEQYEIAIDEASKGFENNAFVDINFTDKYLASFLNEKDIGNIKLEIVARILGIWVESVTKFVETTKFKENG